MKYNQDSSNICIIIPSRDTYIIEPNGYLADKILYLRPRRIVLVRCSVSVVRSFTIKFLLIDLSISFCTLFILFSSVFPILSSEE
jgi:hypothetical protein